MGKEKVKLSLGADYMILYISSVQLLSRVQLFVTPQTVACQASLSLEFSRQEYWSGLPFPFPMHESEK